jgi:hypothetical protein
MDPSLDTLEAEDRQLLRLLKAHPPKPSRRRKVGEVPMPENVFERTLPGFLATLLKESESVVSEETLVNETDKAFDTLRKLSGNRYKGEVRHTVLTCMRTLKNTFVSTQGGWTLVSSLAYTELKTQTMNSVLQRYSKDERVIVNDAYVDPPTKDNFFAMTLRYLKKLKKDPALVDELRLPNMSRSDNIEDLREWMGGDRFSGLLQGFHYFRNRCKL